MQINYVRYRTFILLLRSFAVLPYFISVTKPIQNTAAKQMRGGEFAIARILQARTHAPAQRDPIILPLPSERSRVKFLPSEVE